MQVATSMLEVKLDLAAFFAGIGSIRRDPTINTRSDAKTWTALSSSSPGS
jgi:hypothetical protein